ncbi:MAG TPA: hypothetical protein VFL82_09345 [Thermomicrobiales bacterium]|nr:hypothetical protein [Thermomicrobiales bacterium]
MRFVPLTFGIMVGAGNSNRLVTRFGTTGDVGVTVIRSMLIALDTNRMGDVGAQLPAQAAGPAADNAGAAMENARRWRLPWPGC